MSSIHPLLLRYRTTVTVAANLSIAVAAYLLAFGLRFDFRIPSHHLRQALLTLPLLLLCKSIGFRAANLFRGSWQHVSPRSPGCAMDHASVSPWPIRKS